MLEQLPLLRLRFDLMGLDDMPAPAHKGDLLRRGLLWWLSEYWCAERARCREGCRHPHACLFGRLVEPAVDPNWSPGMLKLIGGETPPPAFALWDGGERRRSLAPGSLWSFELTLIGELAASKVEQVIGAVQESAERGMGHRDGPRLRGRVVRVTALTRPGGQGADARAPLAQLAQVDGAWRLQRVEADARALETRWADALGWAASQGALFQGTPVRALTVRFLSPMVLKEQGRPVTLPDLGALSRAVLRRLRILSEAHGGGEWARETWGPALDAAEAARLDADETVMVRYGRHSDRSGEQEVAGFVGQAWYSGGDFSALLPALWFGQWVQAGKGYAFGNGRYEVVAARP